MELPRVGFLLRYFAIAPSVVPQATPSTMSESNQLETMRAAVSAT